MVANVDNSRRFAESGTFHHGTVAMRVPDGHYWLAGTFGNFTRMVVVPQFTVTKDTTVAVDERARGQQDLGDHAAAVPDRPDHLQRSAPGRGGAQQLRRNPKPLRGRNCAAQPMMTLDYQVAGLGLDGSAKAGSQSVGITAGHIQLAAAAKITAVAAQVSFDGGKTWHAATVTGSAGSYHAAFAAAPGSYVTLRVTAADAVGGSISETIARAYKIAS